MIEVTKRFTWCMAHRLRRGYSGKCKNLHGHNYAALVTFTADELNEFGMTIDFSDIKKMCKEWVDAAWDHGTIIDEKYEDHRFISWLRTTKQKHFLVDFNTTAENIAQFLGQAFQKNLTCMGVVNNSRNLRITKVRVYETETSYADWMPGGMGPGEVVE